MRHTYRLPKVTALAAAIGGLLVLLVPAAAAGPQQEVEVRFLVSTSQKSGFDILIANFGRVYPGIKISPTYVQSATLPNLVQTQFQAGNPPDVFSLGGSGAYPTLAQEGKIADLTSKPWVRHLTPGMRNVMAIGATKKIYAMTLGVIPYLAMYNRDAFRQLGLAPPKTFPELLTTCRRARASGKFAIAHAAGEAGLNSGMLQALAASTVYSSSPKWDEQRRQDKVTFAGSAGWKTALQRLVTMINTGCFSPGSAGRTAIVDSVREFVNQDALMMIGPSGLMGVIRALTPKPPKFTWRVVPTPGGTQSKSTFLLTNLGLALAVTAGPHRTAAETFVDFLARPKQAALLGKLIGVVAPYDWRRGTLPPIMKPLAPLARTDRVAAWANWSWPNGVVPVLGEQMAGLFTGQTTVDGVLRAVDDAWRKNK